jgi:hypothetical protein
LRFSGSKAGWIEEERIWVPETAPLPGKTPLELAAMEGRGPPFAALLARELARAESGGRGSRRKRLGEQFSSETFAQLQLANVCPPNKTVSGLLSKRSYSSHFRLHKRKFPSRFVINVLET